MKRMLDISDLATRIGLKPQTIRNKLNCGTFPIKTKKIGRKLLWDIGDVDKFLDGLRAREREGKRLGSGRKRRSTVP